MKRVFALILSAALCLTLFACAKPDMSQNTDNPDVSGTSGTTGPATPPEPLKLDALNVEFAVGGRDVDTLLALQADFPWALTDALEKQNVTVGKVGVTFGTSGEATEEALRSGAVQLAFLPAEDYYPYRTGLIVAVEQGEGPDLTLGLIVSAATNDADADERLAEALRSALPDLAGTLASYTREDAKGVYIYDAEMLEQLGRLYETGDAVLNTVSATVGGGRELTVQAIGHRLDEYWWGVHTVEVYEGDTLLQTITIHDATEQAYSSQADFAQYPDLYIEEQACSGRLDECLFPDDLNFDGADDLRLSLQTGVVNTCWLCLLWDADAGQFGDAFTLVGYHLKIDADAKRVVTESRNGWGTYDTEYYAPDESGQLHLVRWEAERHTDESGYPMDGVRIIYELQNGELVETDREILPTLH